MTDKKTVLILPGCTDTSAVKMFENRGWEATLFNHGMNIDEFFGGLNDGYYCDAICFMGGTDVDPAVYGEERGPTTQTPDKKRDAFEVSIFERFKDDSVYLFGICRGAQLLNVLNGGKMIQECGYRGGEYPVEYTFLTDSFQIKKGSHNVCHHQGILCPYPDAWSLAHADGLDYMFYYPETKSYGFQGHPEWGHDETEESFFAGIDYIMNGGV